VLFSSFLISSVVGLPSTVSYFSGIPSTPSVPDSNGTCSVYFDIQVGTQNVGRITIALFGDIVPKTAENFRALCTGDHGFGFKGTHINKVIRGFFVQGGIIEGASGERVSPSIYGEYFEDENFALKHRKGSVSMANAGKNRNGSEFFIALEPLPHLDGKNVVFGQVLEGLNIVEALGKLRTKLSAPFKPEKEVTIVRSGVLPGCKVSSPKKK